MKWGDEFELKRYNWKFLLGIISFCLLGLSFLVPFSTFGFLIASLGGIGLVSLGIIIMGEVNKHENK